MSSTIPFCVSCGFPPSYLCRAFQKNYRLIMIRSASSKDRAVAIWLFTGVAMLVIQIALGGLTRLTGSGLSITEWKPILGAIPPMNSGEWQEAFAKYQQIAQSKFLNSHFSLTDFKGIYLWEWAHREWARLVAVVFAIGFVYFLIRRYFTKSMVVPFLVLFVLGALQGFIGWLMVKSGLNDTDLYVSHIRLAIHFMSALVLLLYTLWFALKLVVPAEERMQAIKLKNFTLFFIILLSIQLTYGAFMAGLKAASAAANWPFINGHLLPGDIHQYGSQTYSSFNAVFSHPIAVHFVHRSLAFLLLITVIIWYISVRKYLKGKSPRMLLSRAAIWPPLLVAAQIVLGILTVLHGAGSSPGHFGSFEWLAISHQLVAMCLVVSAFINLYALRKS